jgi:hypothetical protein
MRGHERMAANLECDEGDEGAFFTTSPLFTFFCFCLSLSPLLPLTFSSFSFFFPYFIFLSFFPSSACSISLVSVLESHMDSPKDVFLYSLTLQKPGAIHMATFGNFSAPKAQEVIICRGNRLELHRMDEMGRLQTVLSVDAFATIRAIHTFRLPGLQLVFAPQSFHCPFLPKFYFFEQTKQFVSSSCHVSHTLKLSTFHLQDRRPITYSSPRILVELQFWSTKVKPMNSREFTWKHTERQDPDALCLANILL